MVKLSTAQFPRPNIWQCAGKRLYSSKPFPDGAFSRKMELTTHRKEGSVIDEDRRSGPASSDATLSETHSRVTRRKVQKSLRPSHGRGGHRFSPRLVARMAGFLLVAAGLIVLGRIPFFYLRSWWVGTHLAQAALSQTPTSDHTGAAAAWPQNVLSVVQIPSLGVNAPVMQGTTNAQLNVAVGHLTTSVMPGQPGTSILAAHDVTWFHHIDRLKPGQVINIVEPHRILTFHVTKSAVVHVGTPVYNSANASIVLEACYPLNALYLTPYRYLVWANLASTQKAKAAHPLIPPNTQYTAVGIPRAVKAQGLTLATNYMPMGTLTIKGSPSPAWRQSNAPLNAADATTELFFAMIHIAEANNPAWWHQLAPNIPYSDLRPLIGAQVSYVGKADEVEIVKRNSVIGSQIQVPLQVNRGSSPGNYSVTLSDTVHKMTMAVTKVSMSAQ